MKQHTQATGANAGMIVPCKAKIQCRLVLESEHYYFDDADDVKKFNELTIARDSGGNFGEGLNSNEEEQLQKLREKSENNRERAYLEEASSYVDRAERPEYVASIESKHFTSGGAGSVFRDERAKTPEQTLALALSQRGSLKGNDYKKLIAEGADPKGFLPPESGVRYLKVDVAGELGSVSTSSMSEETVLTVQEKGGADGRPTSLSLSASHDKVSTDFGTIVIGPKVDGENKPIEGTETLWTMHPGPPSRGIRSSDLREHGFEGGATLTVGELRKRFGRDVMANVG